MLRPKGLNHQLIHVLHVSLAISVGNWSDQKKVCKPVRKAAKLVLACCNMLIVVQSVYHTPSLHTGQAICEFGQLEGLQLHLYRLSLSGS